MVSSAPLASMPLIFAAIYNVKTDAVVRAGIFTYLIALFSVPLVGGIIWKWNNLKYNFYNYDISKYHLSRNN